MRVSLPVYVCTSPRATERVDAFVVAMLLAPLEGRANQRCGRGARGLSGESRGQTVPAVHSGRSNREGGGGGS